MQRNLQKRRTTASKEINKNIKEKTMIEKKLYNRIEESFEKLDEQNEEEENDDNNKNEDESKIEDENENDNQNKKETTEKEK